MKVIDLSHTIGTSIPVYPGSEPPVITQESTIEKNGSAEKRLSFLSHTGTHIDAPSHMLKGGASLEEMDISLFTGRGCAVDVSEPVDGLITPEALLPHRDLIDRSDFLILHSGWYRYSRSDSYFKGFPVLSSGAAEWLTGFKLKGVGVDMISVDPVESTDYCNHLIFFRNNMIIIENLRNTDHLLGLEFTLHVFPLKISGGDGSPVRAVAIIS